MKARESLKDLFYFHESARRGILWLLALMIVCTAIRYLLPVWIPPRSHDNLAVYQRWIQECEIGGPVKPDSASNVRSEWAETGKQKKSPMAAFHPDTATLDTWMRAGLNKGQARTVMNYLSAGGSIRTRQDLKKIRVIDISTFDRVSGFLDLPDSTERAEQVHESRENQFPRERKISVVDVNSADTTAWKTLPGIGSYYARKIVDYREKLGGFCSIDQLSEVQGMRDETFQRIRPHCVLSGSSWRKIRINDSGEEELRHPYLNRTQIRTLVAWREKHGPYSDAGQLQRAIMLSDAELIRLMPYLPF